MVMEFGDDQTMRINVKKIEHLDKVYASLVVLQGNDIGRHYHIAQGDFTLGRSASCSLVVSENGVSRNHAVIRSIHDSANKHHSYTITDLESTNHTIVNNKQVSCHQLSSGDKIKIGDTILKFVFQDEVDLKFHEDLRKLLKYDALTGLLTKESLYMALEREIVRSRKYNLPLAVLMMDLDHFKNVNDTHCHQTGSNVLKGVGGVIRNTLRKVDVSARYGGEEFVSYLAERPKEKGVIAANRLREGVK